MDTRIIKIIITVAVNITYSRYSRWQYHYIEQSSDPTYFEFLDFSSLTEIQDWTRSPIKKCYRLSRPDVSFPPRIETTPIARI